MADLDWADERAIPLAGGIAELEPAIATALRQAREQGRPKWQTIDTAPRDGSRFLAFWPESGDGAEDQAVLTTWFELNRWQTPHESADPLDNRSPTHWMPYTPPGADK